MQAKQSTAASTARAFNRTWGLVRAWHMANPGTLLDLAVHWAPRLAPFLVLWSREQPLPANGFHWGRSPLLQRTAAELAKHPAAHPDIVSTSAVKQHGIAELRAILAKLAEDA